jgi:hypothetical protein
LLLINSGEQAHLGNKNLFSFALSWLREEGFAKMIKREQNSFAKGSNPIEVWQNNIYHLRRFLRGWARNRSGVYKKEKERLLAIIDELDIKAETSPLNTSDSGKLREANDKLLKLRR